MPNISNFSTHSARSGSATLAANSGVSEENIQRPVAGLPQKLKIFTFKIRCRAGLKSSSLCPSELKPFLFLSSVSLADRRPNAFMLFVFVFHRVAEAKYVICANQD